MRWKKSKYPKPKSMETRWTQSTNTFSLMKPVDEKKLFKRPRICQSLLTDFSTVRFIGLDQAFLNRLAYAIKIILVKMWPRRKFESAFEFDILEGPNAFAWRIYDILWLSSCIFRSNREIFIISEGLRGEESLWKTSLGLRVTVFILTGVTDDAPERELRVHTRMSNIIWRSVPVVRRRRGPRCHGLVSARCIRDPLPRKLCDSGGGKSGVAGSTFHGSDRLWLWRLIYATGSNSTRSNKGVKVTQCHWISFQQDWWKIIPFHRDATSCKCWKLEGVCFTISLSFIHLTWFISVIFKSVK